MGSYYDKLAAQRAQYLKTGYYGGGGSSNFNFNDNDNFNNQSQNQSQSIFLVIDVNCCGDKKDKKKGH